jgi:ABC-type branched-subunit amino acid transport system ATPase component/ABC-type branched-subunit amino acid transport system permease subunit
VIELTVVRRLFDAPRVILFVATLGVTQLIILLELLLPDTASQFDFPTAFTTQFTVAGILVRGEHIVVFAVVPLVTMALAWFLARTRYGRAIRASAANPDAAALAGVSPRRMSTLVWTIAGAFAALTAVLVGPFQIGAGTAAGQGSGAGLLLRALAAALIGGMVSLPLALLGGVAIGIVEAVLYTNVINTPSLISMVLFVLVLVLVLVRGRTASRDDADEAPWSFSPRTKPIPPALRDVWWVRHMSRVTGAIALVVLIALPLVITLASSQFLYSRVLLFALVALSLTVLTGWAGQLSLGQFGFVGLGAFTTAALHTAGIPFGFGILIGGVVGVVAAVVIGLPALRVKGLFLAVTTLAFAIATQQWLLSRSLFLGGTTVAILPRAHLGPVDLRDQRTYYYLCLAALVIAIAVVTRLRNSGIGRSVIATRDNERSAAAFTLAPARAKLTAFAISGAICGLAGGLFAGLFVQFGVTSFPVETSISVVTIAVIGGLGSVVGPVLGALWVIGLPAAFGDDPNIALLTSGIGLLFLLMYFPGGLIGIVYLVRDQLLSLAARGRPSPARSADERTVRATDRRSAVVPLHERVPEGDAVSALRVEHLSVRFGGIAAVDDVSIELDDGAVVGLIGANGAGKSTLMNAISGFVPSRGRIELLGHDISQASAAQRARAGLGRTFQQAHLFPDLTVRETVATALEAHERTSLTTTVLGLPAYRRRERQKLAEADDLVDLVGLGRYANSFIRELSTGTRRIAELACLLALDARVLCLDEPTAGVAQRETEAFGPLLLRIRAELDATLLVIEHDMPLIFSISDKVYCLETGKVIASGTPADVRDNPLVIASYLGTDERAIHRSDITTGDQT